MQGGVVELSRSLVRFRFTEPLWVFLDCAIQFEQMLFTGYCSEIPNLSAYAGAVTAFLLDGNVNLSVFALNQIFARKIRAFRRSRYGFRRLWHPIPRQECTDTEYSHGGCDHLLRRQHGS